MKKADMKKHFGLSTTTLHDWDKGKQGEKRRLLYQVLSSLPVEYVKQQQELLTLKEKVEDYNSK